MKQKYGTLTIGLHWFMLLLFIAIYASVEMHELFPKGNATRATLMSLHFMLGMSVLAFLMLRIAARVFGPATPQIEPAPKDYMQLFAKLMHLALYVFMIAMPISGWLMMSAAGKPIPFGLPPLIGADEQIKNLVKEGHEVIGNLGYALVGLHAVAALFHHYVVRDNTLRRILPFSPA